jgi:penicillin-binding protein 1A
MSRRERQRRRRRNRGSSLKRMLGLTAVLVISAMAVGALAITGWVVNVAQSAPNLKLSSAHIPGSPSQVFAANGTSLGYIWSSSVHTPIAGYRIPSVVKKATIAIEDRRFYQHGALDYQGIVRAAIKDTLNGQQLQGASTLTMQLVDNVYLPKRYQSAREQRNLKYKIVQAKLATQLEAKESKNWILNSYLNDVPYGTVRSQTAYGVGAASEMFFDKPVSKLTLDQAALLAGLPQAPSAYNPFIDPGAARRRRNEVLQAMVTADDITQAQADAAARRPLDVKSDNAYSVRRYPYVFDYVEQEVARDLCPKTPNKCPRLTQGGMKIYTTIDLRKQALALQAIRNHAALLAEQGGASNSAAAGLASVDPANGHILAIASSSNYSQTNFDYATEAHRQPGSSFKVFVLMTLIHDYHGDPNTTYYDSHELSAGWLKGYPTYEVHTSEDTYQGDISVTKATVVSDNTVFAQLDADLTPQKVTATAYAMGITTHLNSLPAEAIGGLRTGVTPLEMADAYSTLANGGVHVPTTIINKIVFPDGSVGDYGDVKKTRVFTAGEAYEGTSVLKGVITSGTGTAANYGCPAAGKTGTANNLENAWFVGYTPRMATAVWVGYPQGNIPMADGFGGALAAPIWHDYMETASGSYCGDFPTPAVPFQGTSFAGHYTVNGGSNAVRPNSAGNGTQPNGGAGLGQTTSTTGTTPYNNPTLYAHPPQTGNGNGTGAGQKKSGAGASGGSGLAH